MPSRFPRITVGLNKLTPEVWDRGASLLEDYERYTAQRKQEDTYKRKNTPTVTLAAILGYKRISTGIGWWYAHREVVPISNTWDGVIQNGPPSPVFYEAKHWALTDDEDAKSSFVKPEVGPVDPFGRPALNMYETYGSDTYLGYDLTDPALPTTIYSVKPIRNDAYPNEDEMTWTELQVIVRMQWWPMRTQGTSNVGYTLMPVFERPNAVYPTCPTP